MADDFDGDRYDYEWSAFAIQDGKAPDTDGEIDVGGARSITIQFDTTPAGNVSTDTDLNIITSPDNINWDTEPYATLTSQADADIQTFALTPGINFIKLRADNNDGANNSAPEARVYVRR